MVEPTVRGLTVEPPRLSEAPDWPRRHQGVTISVGVADGVVARGGRIRTSGLGSCVAVLLTDEQLEIGGLIHAMLPAPDEQPVDEVGRYVTTAVPSLIAAMEREGVTSEEMAATIVGGATMLEFSAVAESIGDRNTSTAESVLADADIEVVDRHVGGTSGRSVSCDLEGGEIEVHTAGE